MGHAARPGQLPEASGGPYTANNPLMYFDFDPHRPDTPRMPQAMSLREGVLLSVVVHLLMALLYLLTPEGWLQFRDEPVERSEEHTSELQSRENLVCRLLLEKKDTIKADTT